MFGVGAFSTCTRFEERAPSESEPSDSSDDDEPRTASRPRFEELSLGASGLRTTRHTALGRREQRDAEPHGCAERDGGVAARLACSAAASAFVHDPSAARSSANQQWWEEACSNATSATQRGVARSPC